jgi:hypothetical protein
LDLERCVAVPFSIGRAPVCGFAANSVSAEACGAPGVQLGAVAAFPLEVGGFPQRWAHRGPTSGRRRVAVWRQDDDRLRIGPSFRLPQHPLEPTSRCPSNSTRAR